MSETDEKKSDQNEANGSANEPAVSSHDAAQEEAAKWKNEYLYLKAEFENYKRNNIKERSDLLKFGAERVARDILEVVDNFERALQTKISPETIQNFKVGIEMTAKELKDVLAKHGISEVPSEGQPFNPAHHEAISSEPTMAVPVGHVSRVFKKPYKLHDKIIRMGQVVVASKPEESN
ncbi:MAG: GrpE protein [Pseudobdellovibrio sp.]|nr:GrpE protein [Pseudobdellovibrio sp.]